MVALSSLPVELSNIGSYDLVRRRAVPDIPLRQVALSEGLVLRLKNDRRKNYLPSEVRIYADMTQMKVWTKAQNFDRIGGGRRAAITEFSKSSRRNMLRALAQMRIVGQGQFVHLTFPGMVTIPGKTVVTKKFAKDCIASFRKRLARKLPTSGGIWRMELKKRKTGASTGRIAPHFHVMVFGVEWTDKDETFRQWVARVWNEIVAPSDESHRKAGTTVDQICNRRHAMAYASKYAAKDEDDDDGELWGRRWGTWGEVDRSPIMVFYCKSGAMTEIRRDVRKLIAARERAASIRAGRTGAVNRRKSYAKRLAKIPEGKGFSVLGVGELTRLDEQINGQSIAWKMIALPLLRDPEVTGGHNIRKKIFDGKVKLTIQYRYRTDTIRRVTKCLTVIHAKRKSGTRLKGLAGQGLPALKLLSR